MRSQPKGKGGDQLSASSKELGEKTMRRRTRTSPAAGFNQPGNAQSGEHTLDLGEILTGVHETAYR